MEFSSAVPIYVQLAEDLRRRILSGELGPGEKVMSTTEYAATYRINPATANKAFSLLVEEGILEKRRGIGMFVTAGAQAALRERGRATYLSDTLAPALAAGRALGLSRAEISALVSTYWEENQ
ncbi:MULTISPECIES: GntR family transcriptional regulator [Actinotignum]|uniref:GntR family transcriptional regulator n=1 Tax=Actinotignum TaxID=1653174 RepID=UPI00254CE99B|nr:GntR family transcriptional regulator [Actinotignum schaalii]MDK7270982.1 GntR family transcriptional regulator [Actinotignum schaalii]